MAGDRLTWQGITTPATLSYLCHFCGNKVASEKGWIADTRISNVNAFIFVCPNCTKPTFFDTDRRQIPALRLGNSVNGITDEGVEALYNVGGT